MITIKYVEPVVSHVEAFPGVYSEATWQERLIWVHWIVGVIAVVPEDVMTWWRHIFDI